MKWLTLTVVGMMSSIGTTGWAQEEGSAATGEVKQSGAIMIEASSVDGQAMQVMSFSTDPTNGPMFFSSGADGASGLRLGGFAPDPFGMLGDEKIQKELDLVGEQLEQYKELQERYRKQMQEQLTALKSGNVSPDQVMSLKDVIGKMEEQKRADMEGLLLPGQLERLHQINFQQRMKQSGAANALRAKETMEALGLTEEDVARLKDKAEELNKSMQEKVKALREEMQRELLKELSADQRKKLEAMTGEPFDYSPQVRLPGMQRRIERNADSQSSQSSSSDSQSSRDSSSSRSSSRRSSRSGG